MYIVRVITWLIVNGPSHITMFHNVRIYVYVFNGHGARRTAVNERTGEPSASGSDRDTGCYKHIISIVYTATAGLGCVYL